ncbi:MAG: C39 family peptidase [Verrucomicrobiales bacterium]|nr:C39 family peptidase [Verrucomicrobiales bacterium]
MKASRSRFTASFWRLRVLRPGCCAFLGMVMGLVGRASAETRLISITNFSAFTRVLSTPGGVVLMSPELEAGIRWKELIVSWNAATNVALSLEARPVIPGGATFLSLGRWASAPGPDSPRESVNGQKEPWGEVQTDVLVLKEPAMAVQVRLGIRGPVSGLRRLSLAFSGPDSPAPSLPPQAVVGRKGIDLPVPIRSQADYPEGVSRWCSPTSTAMLMAYWGERLGRTNWVLAVPEVARAVMDPGWGGTGNWPFNMALPGSLPGLNSAVARWEGLPDLERWVAAGLPVAASVSYALLKGRPSVEAGDGHLIVVRGFTESGDVLVNDPGVRQERVRREFPRSDFDRAWSHSGRTVYLVWPDGRSLPEGPAFPR